jgi:peptidoglycan/LPS O-acetylase OafA/YrhL
VDGNLGVLLGCLISGWVLTDSAARRPRPLSGGILRRALRLWLPLLAAGGFALLLVGLLPGWFGPAAALSGSEVLAAQWLDLGPGRLLAEASGLTLLLGHRETTVFHALAPWLPSLTGSANLPVWSLHLGLLGGALVLGLAAARRRGAWAHGLVLVAALGVCGGHALGLFVLGHGAALLAGWPAFRAWARRPAARLVGVLLLALGAWLAGHSAVPGLYQAERLAMAAGLLRNYDWFFFHKAVAAVLLLAGLLLLTAAQGWLGGRLPTWLGRVSLGVYLLHWPVMLTLGAAVFLWAAPLGHGLAAGLALLAGLAGTLPLALGFARWVERPVARLLVRGG